MLSRPWIIVTSLILFFPSQLLQIDLEQFEKVMKYIKSGIESGATLETGGERVGNKGYYIQPTVFSDVKV